MGEYVKALPPFPWAYPVPSPPVPPWEALRGVVMAEREVMSELAPLAAGVKPSPVSMLPAVAATHAPAPVEACNVPAAPWAMQPEPAVKVKVFPLCENPDPVKVICPAM